MIRQVARYFIRELQALAASTRPVLVTQALDQLIQTKGARPHAETAGLQFGQSQNAIDHVHHFSRRTLGSLGVQLQFGAHIQGFDQLQRADHAVHRRTQFMGDGRQKFIFKLVGMGQLLVHCGQFLPGLLQRTRLQVTHRIDAVSERQRQQADFDGRTDLAGVHSQEHIGQVAQHHQGINQPPQQKGRPGDHKVARHPQATHPGHDAGGKNRNDKRQGQACCQAQRHGIAGGQGQHHDQYAHGHQQHQGPVQPAAVGGGV